MREQAAPHSRNTASHLRVYEAQASAPEECSDESLMLRHCRGDEKAFEELVRRHQRPVFNYIHRMVQNRHVAEELTQEVFLALVRNVTRYEPTAKFTTYLYTIASNIVSKEWTRQKRRPILFSLAQWWRSDGEDSSEDEIADQRDTRVNVRRDSERNEISAAVNEALQHVPEHQRQAFILRRFHDLSYEEIAEILDVPVGTVKSRVVRAERALRPYLEPFREYL